MKNCSPSWVSGDKAEPAEHSRAAPTAREDRRFHSRQNIDLESTVTINGETWPCRILDISQGGAAVFCTSLAPAGACGQLRIPDLGVLPFRVVRELVSGFAIIFDLPTEDEGDIVAFRLRVAEDLRRFL